MRESPYFKALQTALHGAGVPYGYAITVSSTAAAVAGQHGPPRPGEILLFALGATIGYGGLVAATWETGGEADRPLTRSPYRVRAGIVHLAAIGLAICAALLIARLDSIAAWPLATLAATLLYLAISSVEVAALEHESEPES